MEPGSRNESPEVRKPPEQASGGVVAPAIDLPKGGGAIRGIGEKFAANPVTGTGSLTVPIATSPGRSGFGPQLSLSYDSGAGNGPFGLGWNLSLPSITRKTDKGLPQYLDSDESDEFILSGAEDLVPVLVKNTAGDWKPEIVTPRTVDGVTYNIQRYRPRIEGLFAHIERWTNQLDPADSFWRSISKDNITTWYGKTNESRIIDPSNPTHIFSWLICESYDDKGNVIRYEYKPEDSNGINLFQANERNRNSTSRSAQRYLKRIQYGNIKPYFPTIDPNLPSDWMFETVFDYGEHDENTPNPDDSGAWSARQDPFSIYRAGFEVRTYRLCQRVLMFHHFSDEEEVGENCLVRSTDFNYRHQQSPTDPRNPIHTVIDSFTQCSYQKQADNRYLKKTLPPLEFAYSPVIWGDSIKSIASDSTENLPSGVDGSQYQWVDLDGEGLSGVLTEQGGAWFYKHNESPVTRLREDNQTSYTARLSATQVVKSMPSGGLAGTSNRQFLDLAGNGQIDLVAFSPPLAGFYQRTDPIGETEEQGWNTFQAFKSLPNINWNDPNLKFIDLTGDGHSDILITENEVFTWYRSLAEQGFAQSQKVHIPTDEEQGPRVIFADLAQTLFQADFTGDGLTDIVRIRNGEVCYWPNLGYGRFGAKVTMDHSPHFDHPDQFSSNRLRLTDIDGSGTIDIIYLGRNETRFWFNQSGNSWSEPHILEGFPRVDNIASVAAVDLLGNGTACLVWSSPLPGEAHAPMRYIELMAAGKPHLLINTKNNLGAETHIQYAPSTYFYLKDKQAGKPWITKLPFPVHVVEKVTVTDKWNKTTFSSTYSYHHGYFDGHEREFRGFGRVEQIDAESYGEFTKGNVNSPYITDDHTLYQPPIKTVTWYHTGAMIDREKILSQYQHEYFPHWLEDDNSDATTILGAFQEAELPEPDLKQQNLDAGEYREALRACKGMVLRQEVYELDVDALVQGKHQPVKLYSTAYNNYHIQRLQPRNKNPHAVFLVTESEAISYQYELNLQADTLTPDPRIAHTFNLNIDKIGNVLQAAAIVYPRIGQYQDDTLAPQELQTIQQVQQETHIAYTENHFTNDINDPTTPDIYRLRVPCEVLTYEMTGIRAAGDYFTLEELRQLHLSERYQTAGIPVNSIPYHQISDTGTLSKRLVEHSKILYFNDRDRTDPAFLKQPLPFAEQGILGLPFETYTLALTDDLLDAILADKLTSEIQTKLDDASKSGYLSGAALAARFAGTDTTGQYWIRSGIAGFSEDAADHFFLPERYTDAFEQTTTLNYDPRDLYIQSSTDPAGNTVSVEKFDYRVLAPSELKDINDNLSEVLFDVLGLPTATAVKGKGDQADNLLGFTDELLNPDRASRLRFFAEPKTEAESITDYQQRQQIEARRLLGNASSRNLYYFGEIEETLADGSTVIHWGINPASACGIVREQHVAQLDDDAMSPLQIGFEYSDGGGNVLVSKVQAEPETEEGPLRWIANGKTILNNKGKPVKQYEPYFSESGHHFEEPREVGVTAIIYYDAAGRVVRTELPDGTLNRVEFSPWHVTSFDANDTVLDPDNDWYLRRTDPTHEKYSEYGTTKNQRAARLAADHANTPATVFLDSLGREVISVAHNRVKEASGAFRDEKTVTFSKLDAEGKPLWIRDARGNLVMQYITPPVPNNQVADPVSGYIPCYDIAGNLLFQHSMDGGDRWMINDAAGQPFYAWDENERVTESGGMVSENRIYHTTYDKLRRPIEQQLKINTDGWQVIERLVYGEGQPNDKAQNLRGQLYQHYDSSGLISNQEFDFKGNLLEVQRQLASAYQATVIHWPAEPPATSLEEPYSQRTEYDALNRMVRLENWHLESRDPATYTPKYNQRGLLTSEKLKVNSQETEAILNIKHDAKGQRTRIQYGNGTLTRYDYDPQTFRLIQLRTTRNGFDPAFPEFNSERSNNNVLQQLSYTYDPVGNITEIYDEAYEPVFFKNQRVEPRNRYTYDALYRLVEATGRENASATAAPQAGKLPDVPGKIFPITDQALRNYTQSYVYDSVGNIEQMVHVAGTTGSWTRNYEYAADSNRLERTWLGNNTADAIVYDYDTHGSMLNLIRTSDEYRLRWDYNDMIHHVNLGGGGDAWYSYGADKERSRKRIERVGNEVEERLYLGGMEHYRRWVGGSLVEEIETFHLFVDDQRVLMVEDVIETDNDDLGRGILFKYQYGNHLGSVGLELDADAAIISYEEYHPYGTTAYSANNAGVRSTRKRYRYTGMERDEETGLSYHSARYYLGWLGRWGSVDPIGVLGGIGVYIYSKNNPLSYRDITGEQSTSVSMSRQRARQVANSGARRVRRLQNMTDPRDQAGHTRAARYASESGISAADLNAPESFQHLNSRRHQGLDVDVTDQQGLTRTTTRHRAQETLIDANVEQVRAANGGVLTPEGQIAAGDQVLWQTQGTGLDQREVLERRQSGLFDEASAIENSPSVRQYRAGQAAEQVMPQVRVEVESPGPRVRIATETAEAIGEEVAERTTRRLASRVGRGVVRGIPLVGILFALDDIEEAADRGEFGRATLMTIGLVVDPVDWAVSVYDVARYMMDSSTRHRQRMREDPAYRSSVQRGMREGRDRVMREISMGPAY